MFGTVHMHAMRKQQLVAMARFVRRKYCGGKGMKKIICDRCGKEVEEPKRVRGIRTAFHFVYFTFFGSDKDDTHEEFELCAHCAEKLWNWLHEMR